MAAVPSAVPSAVPAVLGSGGPLIEMPLPAPMGQVAVEFPGVLGGQHGDPWFGNHSVTDEMVADQQVTEGPPGVPPHDPFESSAQINVPAGPQFLTGVHYANHDVAVAPFDSNAGVPFAGGPGAAEGLSDGLHEWGRGSDLKFFEDPPNIGSPYIDRIPNESLAPQVAYDPVDGKQQSVPQAAGNRATAGAQAATSTFDGYTAHDQVYANPMSDVVPRWIPYEERPIYANLAALPGAISSVPSAYGVPGGNVTDMANMQPDMSYVAASPPDPSVTTDPASTYPSASIGSDWVL